MIVGNCCVIYERMQSFHSKKAVQFELQDVSLDCIQVVFVTGPQAEMLKTNFTRDFYDAQTDSYKVMDIDACGSG